MMSLLFNHKAEPAHSPKVFRCPLTHHLPNELWYWWSTHSRSEEHPSNDQTEVSSSTSNTYGPCFSGVTYQKYGLIESSTFSIKEGSKKLHDSHL